MNTLEQLEHDLKESIKLRDAMRTSVLRLVKSALKNQQIEVGHELSMPEVIAVLQKEAKKRHDAAQMYHGAGRNDLAEAEESEAKTIETYLPEPMNEAEMTQLIDQAIAATGASSRADMGRVIAWVRERADGRADGSQLATLASTKLPTS